MKNKTDKSRVNEKVSFVSVFLIVHEKIEKFLDVKSVVNLLCLNKTLRKVILVSYINKYKSCLTSSEDAIKNLKEVRY